MSLITNTKTAVMDYYNAVSQFKLMLIKLSKNDDSNELLNGIVESFKNNSFFKEAGCVFTIVNIGGKPCIGIGSTEPIMNNYIDIYSIINASLYDYYKSISFQNVLIHKGDYRDVDIAAAATAMPAIIANSYSVDIPDPSSIIFKFE